MDADLLPELSGETWVASALLDELTGDLQPAGVNNELVSAKFLGHNTTNSTVMDGIWKCSAVASMCRTGTGTSLLATTSWKSESRLIG